MKYPQSRGFSGLPQIESFTPHPLLDSLRVTQLSSGLADTWDGHIVIVQRVFTELEANLIQQDSVSPEGIFKTTGQEVPRKACIVAMGTRGGTKVCDKALQQGMTYREC